MDAKLFDGELKLMELVWRHEPVSAKELSVMAAEAIGWNKNTTYTVLKKLAAKGVIRRADPGFITALVRREEVARAETESLIQKLYAGSRKAFFAAFLQQESLTPEELAELKDLIERR